MWGTSIYLYCKGALTFSLPLGAKMKDFSSATKLLTFSWQQPSFARLRAPVSTGSYLISSSSTGTTFCWVNKMSHLNSLQASSDLET